MNLLKTKDKGEIICFLMIFLGSLLFSFLLPIAQVPDEPTHIKALCESIGLHGVFEQYDQLSEPYIQHVLFGREQVDFARLTADYSYSLDWSSVYFHGFPSITILRYLPQMIGFALGILLHVPFMLCLHMGELTAALIASYICTMAYRFMPMKKELLLAIMSLPMCLQQYGSYNYDATLLPLCFFVIAFILHMYENRVSCLSWIALVVSLLFIGITKPPYVVLCLMAVILFAKAPLLRGFGRKKEIEKGTSESEEEKEVQITHLIIWGINILLFCAIGLYLLRNVSRISILVASLIHFPHYINLLNLSIKQEWWLWLKGCFGYFGWFNASLPSFYYWIMFLGLWVFAFVRDQPIAKKVRFLGIVLSFLIFHLIATSMIAHSFLIHGLPYENLEESRESLGQIALIQGIQGRYFIPIVFPFLLACSGNLIPRGKGIKIYQWVYFGANVLVSVLVLVQRFWIAF